MARTKTPDPDASDRPTGEAGATPNAIAQHARDRVGSTLPPLPPNLQRALDQEPWKVLNAIHSGVIFLSPRTNDGSPRYYYNDFLLEQAAQRCAKLPRVAGVAIDFAELYRGKSWAEAVVREAATNDPKRAFFAEEKYRYLPCHDEIFERAARMMAHLYPGFLLIAFSARRQDFSRYPWAAEVERIAIATLDAEKNPEKTLH